MMAADYRHIGGRENRLGRHYSRFSGFWLMPSLQSNHLLCENRRTAGRIGEDGLTPQRADRAITICAKQIAGNPIFGLPFDGLVPLLTLSPNAHRPEPVALLSPN